MSDQKPNPLTPEQRAIFDSIPVLPPIAISMEERMQQANHIESLKQQLEASQRQNAAMRDSLTQMLDLHGKPMREEWLNQTAFEHCCDVQRVAKERLNSPNAGADYVPKSERDANVAEVRHQLEERAESLRKEKDDAIVALHRVGAGYVSADDGLREERDALTNRLAECDGELASSEGTIDQLRIEKAELAAILGFLIMPKDQAKTVVVKPEWKGKIGAALKAHDAELLQQLEDMRHYAACKDETATTFMNQVKGLQRQVASDTAEKDSLNNSLKVVNDENVRFRSEVDALQKQLETAKLPTVEHIQAIYEITSLKDELEKLKNELHPFKEAWEEVFPGKQTSEEAKAYIESLKNGEALK